MAEKYLLGLAEEIKKLIPGNVDVHEDDDRVNILAEMDRAVKANKFVVFTADDENPLTFVPENIDAVYLEITDITNKLKIFLEDKSRGSDYGD